jgi:hypothetical protein
MQISLDKGCLVQKAELANILMQILSAQRMWKYSKKNPLSLTLRKMRDILKSVDKVKLTWGKYIQRLGSALKIASESAFCLLFYRTAICAYSGNWLYKLLRVARSDLLAWTFFLFFRFPLKHEE